jgi:hypothetical protein
MKVIIYDIEIYPNLFYMHCETPNGKKYTFEVSPRKNEFKKFKDFMQAAKKQGITMVGFNNLEYDYPVLHHLMALPPYSNIRTIVDEAYKMSSKLINTPWNRRFDNVKWEGNQIVPQCDLRKIHHLDNDARSTSLKALQFFFGMDSIEELPYDPTKPLSTKEIAHIVKYCQHDVDATMILYNRSGEALQMRQELGKNYGKSFLRHSDSSIGEFIILTEYKKATNLPLNKKLEPDFDGIINVEKLLFDFIEFDSDVFNEVHNFFKRQVIDTPKGFFSDLDSDDLGALREHMYELPNKNGIYKKLGVKFGEIEVVFGAGGLHASLHEEHIKSDEEHEIVDADFTSWYPSLSIEHNLYPEHMGKVFPKIYGALKQKRLQYQKGTALNVAYKLALNATYGKSNSEFSELYDPKLTMGITINGQLLLCMLAERLIQGVKGLRIIQINTDGITCYIPKTSRQAYDNICADFVKLCKIQLEFVNYKEMLITNVNNYIAVYENGGIKAKGRYEWDLKNQFWKNPSMSIIPKLVCEYVKNPFSIMDKLMSEMDVLPFCIRGKVDKSCKLLYITEDDTIEIQRISRYYVSLDGGSIVAERQPTKRKVTKKLITDWKRIGVAFNEAQLELINSKMENKEQFTLGDIDPRFKGKESHPQLAPYVKALELAQPKLRREQLEAGKLVTICNQMPTEIPFNIDYEYYHSKIVEWLESLGVTNIQQ